MSKKHIPRLYCAQPLTEGVTVSLEEDTSHHLLHVLRLSVGSPVILFDGRGGEYSAEIRRCGKHQAEVRVATHREVRCESPISVTLAQGISRGERMDYSIQKAVELGVTAIEPVETERSVVRLSGDRQARKQSHWQEVARSAAEQCGRDRVPPVAEGRPLTEWLASRQPADMHLMLDPNADSSLRALAPSSSICLLVGPEGGLSEKEVMQARQAGFIGIRLGPRVLRTETAGVAALAALQALWGDLAI